MISIMQLFIFRMIKVREARSNQFERTIYRIFETNMTSLNVKALKILIRISKQCPNQEHYPNSNSEQRICIFLSTDFVRFFEKAEHITVVSPT